MTHQELNDHKVKGTLIGIDYGTTHIGVALGRNGFTSPIKILNAKDINASINDLARISVENRSEAFVIGLPLTADGKETKESLEVRKFAKLLKIRTRKKVEFSSEYGTSAEALEKALELGIPMKRRHFNDDISAALILKRYYEEK